MERDRILVGVGAAIEAERAAQALSVSELARRSHLSKRGLIYTFKMQSDPKLSTLVAQLRAVGLGIIPCAAGGHILVRWPRNRGRRSFSSERAFLQ
jgi:hypothetical protein